MKMIYKIAKTELQTLFYSPIAWLILIVFTIQSVLLFTGSIGKQVEFQELGYPLRNVSFKIFCNSRGLFGALQSYLYLYIPLLTMGLMSREFSSGSIKLLYSSPVTDRQIILGKYLSMVFYALIICAILFVFIIYGAFTIDNFDFPPVVTALLGLFFLICAYSAIGLYMSCLTSYQVVAAIGTFVILFILNKVGIMWQNIKLVREITYWLSMKGRTTEFLDGLVCSEDLLYFLIVISMFIAFSIVRLKTNRQKTPVSNTISRYVAILLVAVIIGFITSRPVFMAYYDATRTKANTLTQNSQDIVKRLKGGLEITSYVNILDEFFWIGMPHSELRDQQRFRQYTRFKPEIKMKYIHYYDKANNPSMDKRYPNLTDKERMQEMARIYRLDTAIFKSPQQIREIEDLSAEENRFVRKLKRESGENCFLRVFYDSQVFPSESEISAAMKKMVMKLPKVAFVTGHGERDCINSGDRDYNKLALEKTFRYSLINQGFDFEEILLDKPVPSDIDIMVIADARKPYNDIHLKNLYDFIERGGNLLIAGEPGRQDVMNRLVAPLGVTYLPGRVAKKQENYQADFVTATPTIKGAEKMYQLQDMVKNEQVITMPGTAAISYKNDSRFKVTELFSADTTGNSWLELETTNFIDDTAKVNLETGEALQDNIATVIALERKVEGKDNDQKIIVIGDADCMSNGEVNISRRNISAANYYMIMASFYWMSDNQVPIDVRRPTPSDRKVFMDLNGMRLSKWMLLACLPFAMLIVYLLIWIRRRAR